MYNRLLLYLVPDKQATTLAATLSAIAFLIGVLDMVSRDFDSARLHLNLSVGIMAVLFVLKFLAMRATYQVAEHATNQLQRHIRKLRYAPPPAERSEAEARAREKDEIARLVASLRQALNNIEPDSPVRPKYEATLEMMLRISRRA